jgi:pimeloyl-ACP methyl ester carboxylesterase
LYHSYIILTIPGWKVYPVLILIGSQDKLISPEDREKLCKLLADEQLEIVEESGHFLYLDSPDVVSKKIVRFTRGGI